MISLCEGIIFEIMYANRKINDYKCVMIILEVLEMMARTATID